MGFPTANLELDPRAELHPDQHLPDGVWAGRCLLPDGRSIATAISIGRRSTFYSSDLSPNPPCGRVGRRRGASARRRCCQQPRYRPAVGFLRDWRGCDRPAKGCPRHQCFRDVLSTFCRSERIGVTG
ncbi:riboflavin kinase [Nocardia coffeae]|uniref:riboflavin kinase n=1 Tax=Nocardia coffeae TaxID=2873381 RepID=UPI001F2591B7|nr:riboflavin kinase [Nocardia coffeae]